MTVRTAQQHAQAYMDRLLTHALKGELNPACLANHRFSLEDGPRGYDMFDHKTDGCVRAVFALRRTCRPRMEGNAWSSARLVPCRAMLR